MDLSLDWTTSHKCLQILLGSKIWCIKVRESVNVFLSKLKVNGQPLLWKKGLYIVIEERGDRCTEKRTAYVGHPVITGRPVA